MNNDTEFKGWDWTELLPLLHLDKEYEEKVDGASPESFLEAEDKFAEGMASQIRYYYLDHTPEETIAFVDQLKAFLKKVIEADEKTGYSGPYFQGILNVQHTELFLQCFAHNLTWMWT